MDAVLAEGCLEELAQDEGMVMEYLPGHNRTVLSISMAGAVRADALARRRRR